MTISLPAGRTAPLRALGVRLAIAIALILFIVLWSTWIGTGIATSTKMA